ncbi:MAG TPA: hypothetical protein VNN80_00410 [Polyangiaceae bacterium]|nr:hypothetical protein [Polyangiaceae bacterium]
MRTLPLSVARYAHSMLLAALCSAAPLVAQAAEEERELDEAGLDAWLSREPETASDGSRVEAEETEPAPRHHGVVFEGSVGALGHLGNMRDVSPVSPWFRLQVGYELLDWLMVFGQGDVALSTTSLASRPPEPRSYALFGGAGGARLTWAAFDAVSFYLQGEAGLSSVSQDVLATYGYPEADRLHPFAGGALGIEWYQLSPHYALAVSGGTRDYFEGFERVYGSRPPLVWFSSVAIRYAL